MVKQDVERIIFWRPALLSLLLHVAVVAAMMVNWEGKQQVAEPTRAQPRYVEARLVDVSQLKRKKAAPARKPSAKPASKPKPVARSTPKAAQPVAKPKPAVEKPVSKPRVEPKPVPAGPTEDELRLQARQELALALEAEDEALAEASEDDLAQSYVALISEAVQNNWSRPPAARSGMEAELIIQLIPTGEVVSVTVARSSGLLAFDRSAINAVQKAGQFPELQNLPSRVFEENFRQFRLLFKPEDLRF